MIRHPYFRLVIIFLFNLLSLRQVEAAPGDTQDQNAINLATAFSKNIKNCTPGTYQLLIPKTPSPKTTGTPPLEYQQETNLISGYKNGKCLVNRSITADQETKQASHCQYSQATLDYIADKYLKLTIIDYVATRSSAQPDEKDLNLVVQMINECENIDQREKAKPDLH